MLASRSIRLASVLLLVAGVASCGALDDGLLQPGWQRLVITVWNNSGRPALIVVAEDQEPMGAAIGRANPNPVPAGTADVTFDFPPGRGWAIWVNPRPNTGH